MPKIIKDLEDKILYSALELFGEYGYEKVNMKEIATSTGIAVGTLYNYYSNKKQLFIDVFNKSWKETYSKLEIVMKIDINSRDKLKEFLEVLYNEMESRKGLGGELIKANVFDNGNEDALSGVKEEIFKRVDIIIENIKKEENISIKQEFAKRIEETFFAFVTIIRNSYSNEKEQNIAYLNYLIDCIIK